MRFKQALDWAENELSQVGTGHLDALVLLEDTSSFSRAHILAHPESEIKASEFVNFSKQIKQRAKHIPLAYIRRKSEFYGREFYIDQRVLEPRPESEAMIEELSRLIQEGFSTKRRLAVIDVGTGSGALIITAKLEHPLIQPYAIDISKDCLEVTKINAQKHKTEIKTYLGNLLEPLPEQLWSHSQKTIVIANLPYIPDNWNINTAAQHEPKAAIFGGSDGLRVYSNLFDQVTKLVSPPAYILCESLPFQHQDLSDLALNRGYRLKTTDDFIQVFSNLA